MEIEITKTVPDEIRALCVLFLRESNFQFIYNKCHGGWADVYLFTINGVKAGYDVL